MSTSPLALQIQADASGLQAELAGKATPAVDEFVEKAKRGLGDVGKAAGGLGREFETQAGHARAFGKASGDAFYNAEMSIRVLNNSLGLQLGRHMERLLAQLPQVQQLMQAAFTPLLIVFAGEAIFKLGEHLVKTYKDSGKAAEEFKEQNAQIIASTMEQAQAITVQNDKLDIQIAKLEHRPSPNRLKLELDQSILSAERLGTSMEEFEKRVDEEMKKSDDHVSVFAATMHSAVAVVKAGFDDLMAGFIGLATGSSQKMEAPKLMAPDKEAVKFTQDTLKQLKTDYADYIISLATVDSDQKKAALSTEYQAKVMKEYSAAITVAKGKIDEYSKSTNVDYSAPIATLRGFMLDLAKEQQKVTQQQKLDQKEATVSRLEAEKEVSDRILELRRAESNVVKSLAEEDLHAQEAALKQVYATGELSLSDFTNAQKTAEDIRLDIAKKANQEAQAIAKQKGIDGQAELKTLNGELEVLQKQHDAKLLEIDADFTLQSKNAATKTAEAQISADERIGEARIARAEQTTRELAQLNKISPVSETTQLEKQEDDLYDLKKSALEKRLGLVNQNDEKQKEAIIALNSEIEVLEAQHEAKLDAIRASGAAKQLALDASTTQRVLEETTTKDDFILRTEQDTNAQRLKNHQESQTVWLKDEMKTLDAWYAAQKAAYKKSEAEMAALKGTESNEYQNLIKGEEALDQQWALKRKQLTDQVGQQFKTLMLQFQTESNNAITSALMGQEKWSKAWTQVYSSMMSSLIQFGLKWVEQWAINELKTLILGKTTAAANAATQITTAAAIGAANAMASTAAIPVVGPAVAPAAGAAMYASIMAELALAAFESGGIVPRTGAILAHEKEGVLPARLTSMLIGAANQNQGTGKDMAVSQAGGKTSLNVTQHIHAAPGMSAKEIGQHSVNAFHGYVRRMNLRLA